MCTKTRHIEKKTKRITLYLGEDFLPYFDECKRELCATTIGETVEQIMVDRKIDKDKIKNLTQKVRLLSEQLERKNKY